MPTVRLEYSSMRFENDCEPDQVDATIARMADNHRLILTSKVPGQPPTGVTRITNARARFSIID